MRPDVCRDLRLAVANERGVRALRRAFARYEAFMAPVVRGVQ
jgi:hypothetical protein